MGMGDVPNKNLVFRQLESTQTFRRVTSDGRHQSQPLCSARDPSTGTPNPGDKWKKRYWGLT